MFLYTAFLVGILGSFHCIGMCGPIALALPVQKRDYWSLLKSRLLYNAGRIVTYVFLGALMGLIGQGLVFSGAQQSLSIGIGLLILVVWLLPAHLSRPLQRRNPLQKFSFFLKQKFGTLFRQKTNFSYFMIGLLNGFLPCGLVYLALAGAIATGQTGSGMLYMLFFGLGTFPVMLLVSLGSQWITPSLKTIMYKKMLPVFTITLGILFILRGLNLGIPYLSPKITHEAQKTEVKCCHTH